MILDHIKYAYGDMTGWGSLSHQLTVILGYIGRFAFPIFAFLLITGWKYTKNKNKYFSRMLLFAILSQVPYTLATYPTNLQSINNLFSLNHTNINIITLVFSFITSITYWYLIAHKCFSITIPLILLAGIVSSLFVKVNGITLIGNDLNIFYTLSIGLATLHSIDVLKNKSFNKQYHYILLFLILIGNLLLIALRADYGNFLLGIFLIVALYLSKEYKLIQSLCIIIWGVLLYILVYYNIGNFIAITLASLLILFYNQKKGFNLKYTFYIIYPLHLLIIGLINISLKSV